MPTRDQVLAQLRTGSDYQEVGDRFGIPEGQAYMIATGLPADGSDALTAEELEAREGLINGGSQALANPPTEVPTRNEMIERWIHERALNDGPMQAAARDRTAEPPEPDNQDAEDILTILRTDISQTKYIQQQLEATPGLREGGEPVHQQERVSLVDMLRLRLSQHELAEEEYFWPAVRSWLPDGDELADKALAQEQEGKDLLQELDGMRGDEDRFDELVEQLVEALRKHVAFEDDVFLRFEQAVPEPDRNRLGRKFNRAKAIAPTRPHPHAPNRPPFNKLAGAAAAPLDRLRDALGERPAERAGQAEDGGQAPAEREREPRLPSERDAISEAENEG
jgi:hypothetical protein